jgi:hypothetical protein
MKRCWFLGVFPFLIILLSTCAEKENQATANHQNQNKNLVGVYEYTYEYNTENLNENHYIKIELENDKWKGWYYGTSDDFDNAREGYLPGFFVKEMDDLIINNGHIQFTLNVKPDDLFNKAIPIKYKNKTELPADEFKKWAVEFLALPSRLYKGIIKTDNIKIEMGEDVRTYRKIR